MGRHEQQRRGSGGNIMPLVLLLLAIIAIGLLLWDHLGDRGESGGAAAPSAAVQTAKPGKGKNTPEPTVEPTPEPTPEPAPEPTSTPWYLVLVNREHPVPEGWSVDPVTMPNGQIVDRRIYEPLMEMFEAAKDEVNQGYLPNVESGYRSYERQKEVYDKRVAEYMAQGWSEAGARAETDKWVAAPGTSEHQLGIAADISGMVYAIFPWLEEHSWEYGFILRYPPSKTAVTGISGEEWHYRFVGKEAAAEIHERDLTLEEYLAEKGYVE